MSMIRPWGMGANTHDDGDSDYGFPSTYNPNNFHPDYEMCTPEEIENHKKALKEWDETQKPESDELNDL